MSLEDVKVGDTIVVGDRNYAPRVVTKVGREYVHAGAGAYRKSDGCERASNGIARSIIGWRTMMQTAVARTHLRAAGFDLAYHVDALRAYIALRREFPLPEIPALDSFEVPR